MKTYMIANENGEAKEGWEEINCESIFIDGDVVKFYDTGWKLLIAYKLKEGEAVLFQYED